MNIYELIAQHARAYPEQTMLSVDHEMVRYADFVRQTDRIAQALIVAGVTPGQHIALVMPNSVQWYTIYWAAVKLGAIPVPLDPQIGEWELRGLLTLANVKLCFIASSYRKNTILAHMLAIKAELPDLTIILVDAAPAPLASVTAQSPSFQGGADVMTLAQLQSFVAACAQPALIYQAHDHDPLMLACTSGSIGNPKVIVVPHHGFYQAQADMAGYLGFSPADVMLLGMPLYHQGGFGMGLQMILNGGAVFYQSIFEPVKFLQLIEQQRITVVQLTATLAKIILSVPNFDRYDLSSLRLAYFAGEVLPMEIARVFFERLNLRVVNIIGSTETATMVVWDSDVDRAVDVNIFRPLPFTAMKILDAADAEVAYGAIGTLFIHTDALLSEYYKNERETALRIQWHDDIKWFNTGDLGERLPDGRVRFTGRAKRVIKRGSNLIYPEEIEAFLLTHPDIEAVAVLGQQHDLIGELLVAHIQPRKGCTMTRGTLIKFCHGKLAAYKLPDQVIITEAMPNDIGKVQYKYLRHNRQEEADDPSGAQNSQ